MLARLKKIICASAPLWFIFLLSGCAKEPQNRVVLYCSVDDVYAKPIIAQLEKQTGLKIDVLYDVESAKTAGLANRIRAEKTRPRADVFWSSALLQTLLLKREGLLQKYSAPASQGIKPQFKDKEGFWIGMGARARVVMSRAQALGSGEFSSPNSLTQQAGKDKIGISNPQFGTASDWAAALCVRWGKQKTLNYFRALKKNGVRVLPGNGVVAENIARGELLAGVCDSDDYLAVTRRVKQKFAAGKFGDGSGVLVPGSAAILKNAPHEENAKKLMDALASGKTDNLLIEKMPGVSSTRGFENEKIASGVASVFPPESETIPNDTAKWPAAWDEIRQPLAQILLSD